MKVRQTQCNETVTYAGAQVWHTPLRSDTHRLIQKLDDDEDISVWRLYPDGAEYLVRQEKQDKVKHILESQQLNFSISIADVQRTIKENTANEPTLRNGPRISWKNYPTLQAIDEYIVYIANAFPSICKVKIVGKSVENRAIKMVSISNGNQANKVIMITSGSHAREWISITSAFYVLTEIITKFDQQPSHVKHTDWHFIPLVNPDGFEYSVTKDRLWRKNRRKNSEGCYGVDINRNFDIHYARGLKYEECKSTYAGTHAFSEPETVAVRDAIRKLSKKPAAYVDIHSYGQHVLYPWSTQTSKPNYNLKGLKTTAAGMTKAILDATKQKYGSGHTGDVLYSATGPAIDWVYNSGTPLSFAIETRDTGRHGFVLPKGFIEPTGQDMLSVAKYLAKVI